MGDALLIRDTPIHERPRERLLARGEEECRNADLIAILLRTGTKGVSAVQVADQLLAKFGTLKQLANAAIPELRQVKGIGRDKAIALKSAFALARRMARELQYDSPTLDTPERVAELLRAEVAGSPVESFRILLLNTRRRLLAVEKISTGTLDTILVHPREVFKPAILANAAAVVLTHNHPSGDPTPSEADIKVTRDLIRAGQLLKIEVLDHVILGQATPQRSQDYVSLRELGYFF